MDASMGPNVRTMFLLPHFMRALRENDVVTVQYLLNNGVDVDTVFHNNHNSKPALCICIEERNFEVAQALIQHGCSVNLATGVGHTPLHLAVSNNMLELVLLLLQNRANVNALSNRLQTPLHLACSDGSYEIYLAIVNAGADIHAVDIDNKSTLIYACANGNSNIALSLIEKGVDVKVKDRGSCTALTYAVSVNPQLDLVRALVQHGAEVNAEEYAPIPVQCFLRNFSLNFHHAATSNGCTILKLLIDAGCKLDVQTLGGYTPLHFAVNSECVKLVKVLINAGCSYKPDNLGQTPLFKACCLTDRELVHLLIASGIDWQQEQWMKNHTLRSVCNKDLLYFCYEESRRFPKLSELSRTVIRKTYAPDLERSVNRLPCPPLLKDFIKLDLY